MPKTTVEFVCKHQLPDEIKSSQTIKMTSDLINFEDIMPYTAICVARKYPDVEHPVSLFTKDKDKAYEDTLLCKMINSNFEFITSNRTVMKDNNLTSVTDYFIQYVNPNARLFLPLSTPVIGVSNATFDYTYEVILRTDDGDWFSYLYIPVKTAGPGCVNLLDCIDDFKDLLRSPHDIVQEIPNTKLVEKNWVAFPFTNHLGEFEHFEFTAHELCDMVTSVRIVEMNVTITY